MSPDNPGVSIIPTADDQGVVVCNLCEAVEDGNATCWACVDRWGWARGNQWHTDLVALLRTRAPGPPMIEADVDAFIRKISERAPDEADAASRFPTRSDGHSVRHEMTADAAHCTIDCIAHQVCVVCRRRKAPRGRSVPFEMVNGLCTDECEGYQQVPKPGHLWPDEEAEVFRTSQAV